MVNKKSVLQRVPREIQNNILKKGQVKLVSWSDCQQEYNKANFGTKIIAIRRFCAQSNTGQNAFKGDSGGPAVVNGKLVGIVASGGGYINPSLPVMYTRIDSFYNWILEKTHIKYV